MTQRTSEILDDVWITPLLIEDGPDSPPPPIKSELLSDDLIGSSPDGSPPPLPPLAPPIENELFPDDLISSSGVLIDIDIDPGKWWREISVSPGELKQFPKFPTGLVDPGREIGLTVDNLYLVNILYLNGAVE